MDPLKIGHFPKEETDKKSTRTSKPGRANQLATARLLRIPGEIEGKGASFTEMFCHVTSPISIPSPHCLLA